MKMFKNIIFDMGNVLLDYSPHTIVSNFSNDVDVINLLVNEIFYQQEWLDLDQGIINDNDAYIKITKRLDTKYHVIVREILDHWHEYLYEREEMYKLLEMLKLKGYKLFLFSNASLRFYDYIDRFKCLELFDQKIISADLKLSKPNYDFYKKAFEICDIEASESFFIDDSSINILKANDLGLDGYIYNGTFSLLMEYLHKINVL